MHRRVRKNPKKLLGISRLKTPALPSYTAADIWITRRSGGVCARRRLTMASYLTDIAADLVFTTLRFPE
jgi:hypothetical protein